MERLPFGRRADIKPCAFNKDFQIVVTTFNSLSSLHINDHVSSSNALYPFTHPLIKCTATTFTCMCTICSVISVEAIRAAVTGSIFFSVIVHITAAVRDRTQEQAARWKRLSPSCSPCNHVSRGEWLTGCNTVRSQNSAPL